MTSGLRAREALMVVRRMTVVVLFTLCAARCARADDPSNQIDANFKYVVDRLNDQQAYIQKVKGQIAALEIRKGDDAEALGQLKELREALTKQSSDVRGLLTSVEKLKAEADGRDKKTDAEVEALQDKLEGLIERVNATGSAAKQRGEQVENFKYQTRIKVYQAGREYRAELESVEGGKVIPLAGKKVEVLEQFKDGKPTPKDAIVTDERGIVSFEKRRTTSDDPRGLYVVFRFPGDDLYRACGDRAKLK